MNTAAGIRWGRVVVGALIVEAVLFMTIPVFLFASMQVFLATVTGACFPAGFLGGWWTARKIDSRFLLHGLLVGIVATAMYFALNLGQSGSLAPAIEIYGLTLFVIINGLRIAGAVAGAVVKGRGR
jgi:putative membrane protein (TIGR04086 family)